MSDGREQIVRKSDQIVTRFIELWPLWLTLAGGVVTAVNFYNTVKNLADDQKTWKAVSDQRRDANRQEFESLRTRMTILENDVSWIKKGK